ncbi:hypothetical protein [Vulcanococcus limneticus]|uniref:hypothetical protein n=1 Tax=Vulcanococcus limneticus TaxID=2170428 RepID=UPI00398BD16E
MNVLLDLNDLDAADILQPLLGGSTGQVGPVNSLPGQPVPIPVPLLLPGSVNPSSSALVITTIDLSQEVLIQRVINADQRRTSDVQQTLPDLGTPQGAAGDLSTEELQRQMNQAVQVITGGAP